jgi:tight adherence protein C
MLSNETALAMFVFALVAIGGTSLSVGLMSVRQPAANWRMGHRGLRSNSDWAYQTWGALVDKFEKRIRTQKPGVRRLQQVLTNAGFERTKGFVIFRALQIIFTVIGAVIGLAFSSNSGEFQMLALAVGGGVGYMIPYSVLKRVRRRRQAEILREIPAVLDLLVVSLEAGLGIADAIKTVGLEVDRQGHVLGSEFSIAAAEMVAGLRLEDCLRNLGERTGVEDIRSITSLLIQSEKIGGSLGPALRASAEQLVANRTVKAEEAAQKSAIKMLIPLVLFTLPAMIIVILGPAILQILRLLAH